MPGISPGMTSVPSTKERAMASANSRPERAISCVLLPRFGFIGTFLRPSFVLPCLHLLVLFLLFHGSFPGGKQLLLMKPQIRELITLFPKQALILARSSARRRRCSLP